MVVDFAIIRSLVRPGRPRYPVFVHRAAALLHASFRPHLAMTPLRFTNPSPPSGWIEDFHLQAVVMLGTRKYPPAKPGALGMGPLKAAGLDPKVHLVATLETFSLKIPIQPAVQLFLDSWRTDTASLSEGYSFTVAYRKTPFRVRVAHLMGADR